MDRFSTTRMRFLMLHRRWLWRGGVKLLAAAEKIGLEGVVSKRRDARYRSGPLSDWIKVKCPTWREHNRERWRLFDRRR
jgi:ATP-dependent DNA ligase